LKAKNKLLFKSINIQLESSQLDYNIYPIFQALETIFIKEASDLLVGAAISQFKTIGFKISNEFNNYHRTQVHVLSENQIYKAEGNGSC